MACWGDPKRGGDCSEVLEERGTGEPGIGALDRPGARFGGEGSENWTEIGVGPLEFIPLN